MKGTVEYENKYKRKINNLIEKNSDITILRGLYSSYSTQRTTKISGKYDYLCKTISFFRKVNKNPKDLTYDDYQVYIASFEDKTVSYRITIYAALKNLAHYLRAARINTDDPFVDERIRRPAGRESEETKKKRANGYLTEEEIQTYLESVRKGVGSYRATRRQANWWQRDMAIVCLILTTGMRCAAIYRLDVSSLDFQKKMITVTEKEGKVRNLALSNQVMQVLDDWLVKRKEILGDIKEDALFISNRKKRLQEYSIYEICKKYGENIAGKNMSPHKLRHTFGTTLYNKTKDINRTAKALGHESLDTTRLYTNGDEFSQSIENADIMSNIIDI